MSGQSRRLRPFYEVRASDWSFRDTDTGRTSNHAKLVREWLVQEIVSTYRYPREWIGGRIEPLTLNAETGLASDGADFCVCTRWGEPYLVVVAGDPHTLRETEERLEEHLARLRLASVGILSDGTPAGTRILRRRFDNDRYDYIRDIEAYGAPNPSFFLRSHHSRAEKMAAPARELIRLSDKVENIFFEAHSHIRDIDGMHSDEALDELSKVLYAKIHDEEQLQADGTPLMQRWLYGTTEEFAASVRHVYQEATSYDMRVFRLRIPEYERSRGVFSSPIRLSSPALVKVVETLQEYDLTRSGADVKGRAFQKVLTPATRAGMGQYFTPEPVVRFAVQAVDPSVSDLILDPFCGSAHFLTTALDHVRAKTNDASGKAFHEFAFGKLHGIEKSDRMVRIAMTDMRLQGDGHSNVRCTDALLAFENYPDIHADSFDVVLTNPPFGSLLGREALGQLGAFDLAVGRASVPLEVLGLERSVQFLRPGGRLAIVLPDGLLANRKTRHVREWLERQMKLRALVSLPLETFTPYGAAIKTSLLIARKWRAGEDRTTDYNVFLSRVDNVGYDATGRLREGNELSDVTIAFLAFLESEGW